MGRSKYTSDPEFDVEVTVDVDEVIEWVSDNLDPEDVFDPSELKKWAEENGYVREED